jgi:hypothetical protein
MIAILFANLASARLVVVAASEGPSVSWNQARDLPLPPSARHRVRAAGTTRIVTAPALLLGHKGGPLADTADSSAADDVARELPAPTDHTFPPTDLPVAQ